MSSGNRKSRQKKGSWTTWGRPVAVTALVAIALTAAPGASRAKDDYSFIGIRDASQVTWFITRLQKAVAAGDKPTVAALVAYPLVVEIGGKDVEIKDKASFVGHYDQIMTQAVKQSVLGQRQDDIFANKQGVMIGSGGQVWALPEGRDLRISEIRE